MTDTFKCIHRIHFKNEHKEITEMAKKDRRKMTITELFHADHYRSILFLTLNYDKGQGLRQLHYRWALIPDHDTIQSTSFQKEMKDFFKNEDELYGVTRWIVKDCITSNNNLSNFLKKLVAPPYQLLEKKEVEHVARYRLTKKGIIAVRKWMVVDAVESLDLPDAIIDELDKVILNYLGTGMITDLGYSDTHETMLFNECRGFS